MTIRFSLAAVSLLAAAAPALAQADTGFYGNLRLGASVLENMNFAEATTANLNLDPSTGIAVSGALGYRLADPFRVELELGYANNNLGGSFVQNVQVIIPCGTIPGQPCLAPGVSGDIGAFSGFAMAYYDLPVLGNLKPYAGVGLGFVNVNLDVGSVGTMNDGTRSRFAIIDNSDTVMGYRGTLGVAYEMGPVDLTLGYTYTFTDHINVPGKGTYVTFNFDRRVNAHTINAGVVYKF